MDIVTWILAGGVAALAVALVVIIVMFVRPVQSSPARHIVKAKRDGKQIVFLDCGGYLACKVAEEKTKEAASDKAETLKTDMGFVRKSPKGMKYCEGILMGFGEDFRSMVANISIMSLIDAINQKGWDEEEINKNLSKLIEHLKDDLGLSDEYGKIQKAHVAKLEGIKNSCKDKRAAIIKENEITEGSKQPSKEPEISNE